MGELSPAIFFGGCLSWHLRLAMSASLAVLAQMLALPAAFLPVMFTLLILTNASPAVLAQMLAPLELPARNN